MRLTAVACTTASSITMTHCRVPAGESYTRAYPDLMKLHMLQEIEDAWGLQQQVGVASAKQPLCH